jgi:hypothetical protein
MKKILVATIDVEPDCTPSWHYSNPLSFNAVYQGIGKILHPLFKKYNFTPTYLINNVVLEDQKSVDLLFSLKGECELGTHLHPEFIAPNKEYDQYAGRKGVANCCFYPKDIEFEKIRNITELFSRQFGYSPTSFRAGRFSAGENTICSLEKLGYLVDTSVTPHVCWNDTTRERPVDFSNAPEQPYWMENNNIAGKAANGKVLQVPITIALKKRNPVRELISSGAGLFHPVRTYRNQWLRPFYSSAQEMIYILQQYQSKYLQEKVVVYNLMFHNVEVIPGLSPYTKNIQQAEAYLRELEKFLAHCSNSGITASRLSDLYEVFRN